MTPGSRQLACLSSLLLLLPLLLASALTGQIRLVKDIDPGGSSSSPSEPFTWKNHVYFSAFVGGKTGRELWRSDGI